MTLAVLCGITLGVLSAIGRGVVDRVAMLVSYLAYRSGILVGLLLILLFALALRWLPPSARRARVSRITALTLGMRSIASWHA